MRYVRFILLAIIGVVLVAVALANSETVMLRVLPEAMAGFMGISWTVRLPMFVVILLALGAGLLIGFVWEFAREHKHRVAARTERRQREALERDIKASGTPRQDRGDDIIALLEDGSVPTRRAS